MFCQKIKAHTIHNQQSHIPNATIHFYMNFQRKKRRKKGHFNENLMDTDLCWPRYWPVRPIAASNHKSNLKLYQKTAWRLSIFPNSIINCWNKNKYDWKRHLKKPDCFFFVVFVFQFQKFKVIQASFAVQVKMLTKIIASIIKINDFNGKFMEIAINQLCFRWLIDWFGWILLPSLSSDVITYVR